MATAIEDQVKSIGSQVQLASPLGRLLQSIVQAVAATIAGGGTSQFYEAKNLNAQNIVSTGNFKFDTVIAARGITQPDDETFQLTPGKTYHLSFHGRAESFNAATDSIEYRWVDGNLANIPTNAGDAIKGVMLPQTSTQASSGDAVADCIYTAPDDPNQSAVHIRVVSLAGSAMIPGSGMQVTIIEIL